MGYTGHVVLFQFPCWVRDQSSSKNCKSGTFTSPIWNPFLPNLSTLSHIRWTKHQPWTRVTWARSQRGTDGEGEVSLEATGKVDTKDMLENLETLRLRAWLCSTICLTLHAQRWLGPGQVLQRKGHWSEPRGGTKGRQLLVANEAQNNVCSNGRRHAGR